MDSSSMLEERRISAAGLVCAWWDGILKDVDFGLCFRRLQRLAES